MLSAHSVGTLTLLLCTTVPFRGDLDTPKLWRTLLPLPFGTVLIPIPTTELHVDLVHLLQRDTDECCPSFFLPVLGPVPSPQVPKGLSVVGGTVDRLPEDACPLLRTLSGSDLLTRPDRILRNEPLPVPGTKISPLGIRGGHTLIVVGHKGELCDRDLVSRPGGQFLVNPLRTLFGEPEMGTRPFVGKLVLCDLHCE